LIVDDDASRHSKAWPCGAIAFFTTSGDTRAGMVAQAYLAGGHVRVGLEDAVYLQRGVLAETKAAMRTTSEDERK